MNLEQRKSFRIQIPEGRERATLFLGKLPVEVRILDESAGGFAVALLADQDVQQNQVHVLKTATGIYETRIARIEEFADGKLLGLVRLQDMPDTSESILRAAREECIAHPLEATAGNGWTAVMAVAGLIGTLICGLTWFCLKGSPTCRAAVAPDETTAAVNQAAHKPAADVEKDKQESQRKAEPLVETKDKDAESPVSEAHKSAAAKPRQPSRVSPEVLYRLELDAEQSRRIRSILNRASGNTAAAEQEILSLLRPEQASRWQTLAP